jgi:hypothetical protein
MNLRRCRVPSAKALKRGDVKNVLKNEPGRQRKIKTSFAFKGLNAAT